MHLETRRTFLSKIFVLIFILFFSFDHMITVNRVISTNCYASSEEPKDCWVGVSTQRTLGNAESVSLQQIRTLGITCPE